MIYILEKLPFSVSVFGYYVLFTILLVFMYFYKLVQLLKLLSLILKLNGKWFYKNYYYSSYIFSVSKSHGPRPPLTMHNVKNTLLTIINSFRKLNNFIIQF